MVKIKYAFCNHCKKEVIEPAKKPLDSMQKTIWIIIIIGTFGIGGIVFLINNKFGRKKNFCPICHTKLIYSKEPFEKPKLIEALTAKEKVLKKTKSKKKPVKKKPKVTEKKKEKEEIYCQFCGVQLNEKFATCPYCKAALKF